MDTSSGSRSFTGTDALASLFGSPKVLCALLSGPRHELVAGNGALFEALASQSAAAQPARIGEPIAAALPEAVRGGLVEALDAVFRTGEPYIASRTRTWAAETVRTTHFDVVCEPRRDAHGQIVGVIALAVEMNQARRAQGIAADERALLEQIAREAPLREVLSGLIETIEEWSPGTLASILLADQDGSRLRHGAAPSLPDFYNDAIDGIDIAEGAGSCGTAAHRRQTVVVTDIASDPLWPDFRDLAAQADLAACCSTPILTHDGELLGTFALYHREPCAPRQSDLALCSLFAQTTALAIERDRTQRARVAAETRERGAQADLEFVLEASTAIAGELDFESGLRRLAQLTVARLAPFCLVHVIEDRTLRRVASAAAESSDCRTLDALFPDEMGFPDEEVMGGRTAVRGYGDVARCIARMLRRGATAAVQCAPEGGAHTALGVTGYLCVPLTARGSTFGALTLLTTARRPLDDHMITLAEDLARRTAAGVDTARQYAARAALAHELQAGLLIEQPPTIPGLQVAVHYQAAGEGLEVGGDFYDLFRLSDERWAFVIGDVCGRGARAATTTGLVRHTVRAVARLLADPGQIVVKSREVVYEVVA